MKRKLISMLLALCVIMSCFAVSGISVSAATANDDTAAGTITVYFTDALNWGSANVYYWNNGPAWPGTAMTVKETNSYGQKVYRATIPANVEGIIFNSNGNQTVDIKTNIYNGSQWYTLNQKNGNKYMVNYVSGSGTPATQETTAPATQATTTPATGEDTSKHMYVSLGAMPATNQYGCWTWNDGEEGVFAYVQKFQYVSLRDNAIIVTFNRAGVGMTWDNVVNQTVDFKVQNGKHVEAISAKDGNKYKVSITDSTHEEPTTVAPTTTPSNNTTKTVYIGMDPSDSPNSADYKVRYELVAGSGEYGFADITPTGEADMRAFNTGYTLKDKVRWYDIYSAEIPANAQTFCVVTNQTWVWSGKVGDATQNNAVDVYTDVEPRGTYQPTAQYINVNPESFNAQTTTVYVGIQTDHLSEYLTNDLKLNFGWDELPAMSSAGFVSGMAGLTPAGIDYRKLGSDYFNDRYVKYSMYKAELPILTQYFYAYDGNHYYTSSSSQSTNNNAIYIFDPTDAGSTDNCVYTSISSLNPVKPEEPTTEDTTVPAYDDNVRFEVVVPSSTYAKNYNWNDAVLFYGNTSDFNSLSKITLTDTGEKFYVADTFNSTILTPGGWSIYYAEVTPEQASAIDASKFAGFATSNNVNRTKLTSDGNVFKAASGAYGNYSATAATLNNFDNKSYGLPRSIETFDSKTFIINGCANSGNERVTYTGWWS